MADDFDLDVGINIKRTRSPSEERDKFDEFFENEDGDDLFGNILSPQSKKQRNEDEAGSVEEFDDPFAFMNDMKSSAASVHNAERRSVAAAQEGGVPSGSLRGDRAESSVGGPTPADAVRAALNPRNKMTVGPQNPSFPKLMDRNMPSFKLQRERMDDTLNNAPNREDLNDFEKALIKLKGPRRGPDRMTDVLAYDEAKAIVEEMKKATQVDIEARKSGFPSLAKVMLLKKVVRLILRDKVGEQFIFVGGLYVIYEWLSNTPGVPVKFGAPVPEIVTGMLKVLERLPVKKDMLKETKIGVLVNRIWHNPKYSIDIRRSAERVCVKWLAMFQKKDEELDREEDKIVESKQSKNKELDPEELTNEVRPLIEAKRDPKFWDPSPAQIEANELNMKTQRHAFRPMDQPVFSRECLPDSLVSSKVGWNKTNPETTMGKIDRRVQQLSNPNKKAWKNSLCKQVSVEGRGLQS